MHMQSARPHPVILIRKTAYFAKPDDDHLSIKSVYAFPFLYLPAELRDEVYGHLLSLTLTPRTKWAPVIHKYVARRLMYTDNVPTEILRTSRQVYSEAYAVFLRANQFVQLTANRVMFGPILAFKQILAVPFKNVETFPGFIMTHAVRANTNANFLGRQSRQSGSFAIQARDLPALCDGMVQFNAYKCFAPSTTHLLTIHNPFRRTVWPDFLSAVNQTRLLMDAYRMHLRGVRSLQVRGHKDAVVAVAVEAKVQEPAARVEQGDERRSEVRKAGYATCACCLLKLRTYRHISALTDRSTDAASVIEEEKVRWHLTI